MDRAGRAGSKPAAPAAPKVDTSSWTDRQWIEDRQRNHFADDKIFQVLNSSSMQRMLVLLREVTGRDDWKGAYLDFLDKRVTQVQGIWNDRIQIVLDAMKLRGTPGALDALLGMRDHRVSSKDRAGGKAALVRAVTDNRDD